jgi:hypothetical protein
MKGFSLAIENWKKYGRVKVSRDAKGRFIHWEKIVRVARQAYWGKTVAVYDSLRRYQFYGSGKDLQKAVIWAHRFPPRRRHVIVSAEEFLANPFKYGEEGMWIGKPEVES